MLQLLLRQLPHLAGALVLPALAAGLAAAAGLLEAFLAGSGAPFLPDSITPTPAAITVTAATAAPAIRPTLGPDLVCLAAGAFLAATGAGTYTGAGRGATATGAGAASGAGATAGVSCARGCCTAAGTAAGDAIEAAFESQKPDTQRQQCRAASGTQLNGGRQATRVVSGSMTRFLARSV